MAMRTDPKLNDPSEERSLGARLRQAREAAHMSVGQIAAALFLDPQKIEALEADAFDRFAAPAFVRGYLRGYARVLGLPSEPILEMYDRQGFDPPPLDSDAVDTMKQAHTFDIPVRLVSYAVGGVLVLLVGLWWQSQEGVGFDIGADLLGRWPDPVPETSLPSAGAPRPAPDGEEAGDDSIAMAPDPTPEASRDGEPPMPSSGEDTASGGIPADAPAPAGSDASGPLVIAAAPGRGGEALQSDGSPAPSPGEDIASGIPADAPAPAGSDAGDPLVVAAAPGRGGEALQSGGSPAPSPGEDAASGIPADAPAPAGSDAGGPLVAAAPGGGAKPKRRVAGAFSHPVPADAPAPAGSDAAARSSSRRRRVGGAKHCKATGRRRLLPAKTPHPASPRTPRPRPAATRTAGRSRRIRIGPASRRRTRCSKRLLPTKVPYPSASPGPDRTRPMPRDPEP